jgi:long-chain acyl-CoA synthetase
VQLDPDYSFDGDQDALKENIIEFAKEKCSPYEIPKIIEIIDEMPLTAVGKIDKKVLRV